MRALLLSLVVAVPACDCGSPPVNTPPPPTPLPPSVTVAAGVVGRGVVDGVGEAARFDGPAGLAISPDGATAYVADTFVGTVRAVDVATGTTTTLLGEPFELVVVDGRRDEVRFASPRGMAVSPDGAVLWVGDGASVRRVDLATLEVETVAGNQTQTGNVDAVGVDARFEFLLHDLEDDGTALYATDRGNDALRRIDGTTFDVTTIATGFDGPGGLSRSDTTLFIADTFAGAVRSLDVSAYDPAAPDMTPSLVDVATGLDSPQGVELIADDGGALWALGFSAVVERVDLATGEVTALVEGNPASETKDGPVEPGGGNLGGAFASLAAVDGGALFLDLSSSALRKVTVDGGVETLAGPETPFGRLDGPGGTALFESPFSVVATADGKTFFVADTFNHAIRAVDVTRDGDTLSYQVRSLVGRGIPGDSDGDRDEARFSFPVGLALDEERALLYVADSGNAKIRVCELQALGSSDGSEVRITSVRTLAGTGESGGADGVASAATFSDPWDVALNADGSELFVADSSGSTVRKVNTDNGEVRTVLGSFGDSDHVDGIIGTSRVRVPVGVAVANDVLYVSDFEGHTIRAVDLTSLEATTVQGEDGFEGFAEGEGALALLSQPSGLTAAADGTAIFVAETGTHVVRRIATDSGTFGSRFVVGQPTLGGGQGTGVKFSYEEATLLAPEDVAFSSHAPDAVDLVILSEHGVVHAVSVPP